MGKMDGWQVDFNRYTFVDILGLGALATTKRSIKMPVYI
jgi:hypothetical protein